MKTLLTIIFLAITLTVAGQNQILNGSDWTDSNSDGLADFWQSGAGTTNWIEQGRQYCTFQSGSYLEQPFNIPGGPDVYVLECDIHSTVTTYIHISVPYMSFCAAVVPADSELHVYAQFFNPDGLYAIKFMSTQPGTAWVDNVQLYKFVPVGVEEKQLHSGPVRYYDMLGREVPQPGQGFYIRRDGSESKVCYKTN